MNPQIDIVIPLHNASSTIEQCLNGLRTALELQSPFPVVNVALYVVDDGSTDNSADIVEKWLGKYGTLFSHSAVHTQSQQGPSAARNLGSSLGDAPWILYLDSDVEIDEHALHTMIQQQIANDTLFAVNGHPSLHIPNASWISRYVNYSLSFQLKQHGALVNTAFTSLCLMRRTAWNSMNGWDESRKSRYGDDIQSRWHFPPNSILQCFEATFTHHKHTTLKGMCKHRFNLGFHFIQSLYGKAHVQESRNENTVLHLRYPVNVLLAGLSIPLAPTFWLFPNIINIIPILGLWVIALLWINAPLLIFIWKYDTEHTRWKLLSIFGLSYLEGLCMGFGLFCSLLVNRLPWRHHAT